MKNNGKFSRWYDKYENLPEAMIIMNKLSNEEQEELSKNIVKFVNILRKTKSESQQDVLISIGKDRVLGLYKALSNNRWYDKNKNLRGLMNIMSTLSEDDVEKVAEGILQTVQPVINRAI